MNLGPLEIILILALILLLFGARKLPDLARSVGKAKGEFTKGLKDSDAAPDATADKSPDKTPDKTDAS